MRCWRLRQRRARARRERGSRGNTFLVPPRDLRLASRGPSAGGGLPIRAMRDHASKQCKQTNKQTNKQHKHTNKQTRSETQTRALFVVERPRHQHDLAVAHKRQELKVLLEVGVVHVPLGAQVRDGHGLRVVRVFV